jgi:hypothetical protein
VCLKHRLVKQCPVGVPQCVTNLELRRLSCRQFCQAHALSWALEALFVRGTTCFEHICWMNAAQFLPPKYSCMLMRRL